MSDLPAEGSVAKPYRENPFGDRIVEVGWGGGIGVLVVDAPNGVTFDFDPPASSMLNKAVGNVITKDDLAKFEDGQGQHPAAVSLLVGPNMVLENLYGAGDKAWAVSRLMRGVGTDPGRWIFPFLAAVFPGPAFTAYAAEYAAEKAKHLLKPKARWIEVADLKSLGPDTLITGDARIYFGAGETWQELNYGEHHLFWYEQQRFVPPRYNSFGEIYHTEFHDEDRAPGNIGYEPRYDIFAQPKPAPWGIGETEAAGNPGRNAERHIYFFDFKVIGAGTVSVSQNNPQPDPELPSYAMSFRLRNFSRSTKFTLEAQAIIPDREPSYDQKKSFPYTQAGSLFAINRRGFV